MLWLSVAQVELNENSYWIIDKVFHCHSVGLQLADSCQIRILLEKETTESETVQHLQSVHL